jgi:hypothetical protein
MAKKRHGNISAGIGIISKTSATRSMAGGEIMAGINGGSGGHGKNMARGVSGVSGIAWRNNNIKMEQWRGESGVSVAGVAWAKWRQLSSDGVWRL